MTLEQKKEKLHALLHDYKKVAVAFSGGVDSSFLSRSAIDILGGSNVLVLFAQSCLVPSQEQQRAGSWLSRHGISGVEFQVVELHPLVWKEFVTNSEKRCYHCKLRIYKEFLEVLRERDIQVLLDGTNTDDLKDRRPGLQAIHELGIKTPLVAAGFDKNDIRTLSHKLNLDTWNQPSSSCLSTRIPHGLEITQARLDAVAEYEKKMETFGFKGCRVRLHPVEKDALCLQLQEKDFERFSAPGMRLTLIRSFKKSGIQRVSLDLVGR